MAKPSGFGNGFGMGFGVGRYFYCLTQYTWNAGGHPPGSWGLPASVVGAIDLRPASARQAQGGTPSGYAFVASMQPVGTVLAQSLHMVDEVATSAMQNTWQSLTGYKPLGNRLSELLWDHLTRGADPKGITGPKPLMPTIQGLLELHVGGHSPIIRQEFRLGVHPHTNQVLSVMREDFRRQWEANTIHARKVLGYHVRTYRDTDWRQLIPRDLRPHVDGPLEPATTLTDNFNRADADPLGSSSEGWSWTEVSGDIDIVSNEAKGLANGSGARAESDLSSDNHYAQQTAVIVSNGAGPAVRFASGADTQYFWLCDGSSPNRLFRRETGSNTQIGGAGNATSGQVVKLSVSGSTLEMFIAGSSVGTQTDTVITGNTRCGMHSELNDRIDDWSASDLPTPASQQLTFRHRSYRPAPFAPGLAR